MLTIPSPRKLEGRIEKQLYIWKKLFLSIQSNQIEMHQLFLLHLDRTNPFASLIRPSLMSNGIFKKLFTLRKSRPSSPIKSNEIWFSKGSIDPRKLNCWSSFSKELSQLKKIEDIRFIVRSRSDTCADNP